VPEFEREETIGKTMIDLAISYSLLSQRLERSLRPLALNMTQLSLLFHFSRVPGQSSTVSKLVQVMNINQPGITKATTSMVAKGLLRKESDVTDARIKRLFLTAKGLEALEEAKVTTFPVLVDAFSCLGDPQLQEFASHLHTVKTWLDETS
jgi:DNA-binding MarR family transcriptional regulator